MSGFAGWFGGAAPADPKSTLERMAQALPQYGKIAAQAAASPRAGLALRSHPVTGSLAEDGDTLAAIEGYPVWQDAQIAAIARTTGHANALIAAYRAQGAKLFAGLRGAFSLAILDPAAGRALLAIDRFGMQGLCYAAAKGGIVFGSTTDAVRAHPGQAASISTQSIFDYLYFVDRIPAGTTIYREQKKLAPGEYLLCEGRRVEVKSYWRMPYRLDGPRDAAAAGEEMRRLLRAAVARATAQEEKSRTGGFLSGGLDSSSVVAFAAEGSAQKFAAFTIGFSVAGFDEVEYAEIAARRYGAEHHIYYIKPDDALDALERSILVYDEPFANSSVIPAYHCARRAQETGIEVMLAGDGGDELFAGNERYVKDDIFDYFGDLPAFLKDLVVRPVAQGFARARAPGIFGRVARYVALADRPVPERMMNNLFMANDPAAIFSPDAMREIDPGAARALGSAIYDEPATASKVQRMMNFDLRVTLADGDIRKVNRMCEIAGVRVRYPFLDEEVAEFSASLSEEMLLPGRRLRQFYKNAMREILPVEIIDKKKHGFGLPYLDYMNTHPPLNALVVRVLADVRKRGYFQTAFIDDLIARARARALSDRESVVWDLSVLELWLKSRA